MAGDTKDVELRIRARDYSQKTLEQLTDTLANLVDAQAKQIDQAKKGEVSARALEKSYQAIENAAKALIGQHALATTFQKQSEAVEALRTRLDEARQRQEEYAKSVAGAEKLTKEQNKALNSNAQAVKAAERALASMEAKVATTRGRLDQFGISADNLGAAQQAIVENVNKANAALDRQAQALDTVDKDAKEYAASLAQVREAERQAAAAEAQRLALEAAAAKQEREAQERRITEEKQQQVLQEREQARLEKEIADQKERQLQADRQFQDAQAKEAAKTKKLADDQAAAAKAHRDALDQAADKAERLAREYTKMASVSKSGFTTGISETLRDIADPATAAVRGLAGVEQALSDIEAKVGQIKGPLRGYKETLAEVESVQRSLQATAGKVDAYQRQIQIVKETREEFVRAREALKALAEQARAGTGGSDLANNMSAAQAAMRRAAQAMSEQTSKARTMRDELKQLGIATNDMAGTNQGLVTQAQRARSAIEALTAAYKTYGIEVEKADKTTKAKWFDGGRTTLSWMQRIRGEVLALATAYIGLQGAINLAKDSIDAYRSKQTIETRLSQVVGDDAKAIAKEWDYLMGQANRLGFAFEPMALAYSKFALGAKAANMTLQEGRFIFEKFAEGARVARMSTSEFEGALRAVEQMLSKGQIQAEELRGQLGDRLVGAMGMAARAAGMTIEEFNKAMEKGEISAEYVIDLAREVGKTYSTGLGMATKSFEAENARLETAVYKFKLAIAEGGFIEAYTEFIMKLTDLLNSQEGKQLAQSLSDGFTSVVEILSWAADNLDTLKAAFAAFMGLQVFGWLSRVASNFGMVTKEVVALAGAVGGMVATLRTGGAALTATAGAAGVATGAVGKLSGAVTLLGLAFRTLMRFLPVIGAAWTAYEIYSMLAGKKGEAREAGKEHGKEYQKGLAEGMDESNLAATEDPGRSGSDTRVYNALKKQIEREQKELDKKMATASLKGAKADLAERKRLVDEHYDALRKQATNGIKDEEKRAERMKQINALSLKAQEIEEKKFLNEQATRNQGAENQKVRLAREVADEIERIEDDLRKRETERDPTVAFEDRRKARLEAIAHEYDKLMRKIDQMAKFDAKGAAEAKKTVDAYVAKRQTVEGMKADQEELSNLEKKLNDQLQLRTTINESLLAQYHAGTITQEEFHAAVLQNNTTMEAGIASAATKLRTFAESIRALLDPATYATLMARLDGALAKNNSVVQNAQQKLAFAQEAHNKLLAEYKIKQEAINAQEQAGVIYKNEALNAQAALNAEYRDRIVAQTQELRDLIAAATTPENAVAMAELTAQMDNLILKTKDARNNFTALEQTIVQSAATGLNTAFETMVTSLAEVVAGQKSAAEGFRAMGIASAQFFAQFLRDIALAILKQQLFNALKNSGNPILMAVGAAMGAATTKHGGGLVGAPGGTKRVDMGVFSGAAKYHGGGLPGLTASEVPTILEKGEEVLTRDDPRNILNGAGTPSAQKFVLLDDRSRVAEAMTEEPGEQATLINIKKNIPTLKQWMR